MKKSANTSIYSINSQETNHNFFAATYRFYNVKSNLIAMCSQIMFLFQEKLLIIYANIRV